MAVFTENQATQFYVATTFSASALKANAATGATYVGTDKNGCKYIQVKGADTLLRSALIDPKTVMQVKATKAADMQVKNRKATVKFSTLHGTTPEGGQDYTMHIIVRQYQGVSDEQQMVKTAAVHATKGMTAAQFFAAMVESLKLNFKKELNQFFTFTAGTDNLTIEEKEQDWKLGTFEQVPVYFDVFVTTINKAGDEITWGTVTYGPGSTTIKNGKKIADMEYFYMGERGDQYRMIGWPNYVPTKYLVDPTKEYNTLNIHFAYVGSNESCQKSEKDIIIVSTTPATIDSIGQAIADAAGITYGKIATT